MGAVTPGPVSSAVGHPSTYGLPRGLRPERRPRPARGWRTARRARAGQGSLRGGLRSQEPPDVAQHPDHRHSTPVRRTKERSATVTTKRPPSPPSSVQPVNRSELERVIGGTHHNPHAVLGPHPHDGAVTVRTLKPLADSVFVELVDGSRAELHQEFEG